MNKFLYTIIALIALSVCSCKKSESESLPDINSLRPYKMDITDAKSLGLSSGKGRNGSYGEELYDKGLFKIDEHGNISTVAIYFITDDEGNKTFQSYNISVIPQYMEKVSPDFLLLTRCTYRNDTNNTYPYINYSNLLVRISDGLIFCADNIIDYLENASFKEDKDGALYSNNGSVVGKITVSDGLATFQQINTTGSGIYGKHMFLLNDGIICSVPGDEALLDPSASTHCCLLWPNGGFREMSTPYYWGVPSDISTISRAMFQVTKHKILIVNTYTDKSGQEYIVLGNVKIGNSPDDVVFSNPILTIPIPNDKADASWNAFCETSSHYIFKFEEWLNNDNLFVIVIDKLRLEYEIKDITCHVSFYDRCKFNDRYYTAGRYKNEYDKTGFSWFDTKTYQSGFVESDLPYLDRYDLNKEYKYRWDYTSGYITYEAVRPSDGYNITVKADITTGRVETIEKAPDRVFATLITLS